MDFRVTIRVRGAGGGAQSIQPASLRYGDGSRFQMEARADGSDLIVERHVVLTPSIISPEQYPEFARFCRLADRAEQAVIRAPR